MLGFIQSDGSIFFGLRMNAPFTLGPDGLPKPNMYWDLSFSQNLYANVLLPLKAALERFGFSPDFFPRAKRGTVRFSRMYQIRHMFQCLDEHIPHPWFIGQKARNVLILRYVLQHNKALTGAQLVGLHFSLHKSSRFDSDVPKRKWTRAKVCHALGLSLDDVEAASEPILAVLDQRYAIEQDHMAQRLKSAESVLNPFYVVVFFSGDGVAYVEKPTFTFNRQGQPCVNLWPCIGFFVETHAKLMLSAMVTYFSLQNDKAQPRSGSFELRLKGQADVKNVLDVLSNPTNRVAHVHVGRVAELNLLQWACDLKQHKGEPKNLYRQLEAFQAENFRVAFLTGSYKNKTYTYETITQAMAEHLGVPSSQCRPYSFYTSELPPADYLDRPGVQNPVRLPKPKA